MPLRPLVVPLVLLFSLPLAAATFTVTSGADSGPGTLRQAILDANANPGRDQIVLQADVTIDSPLPDITAPIDLTGAGSPRHAINVNPDLPGITRLKFVPGSDGSTVDSIVFGPADDTIRDAIDIVASNVTVTNVDVADMARVIVRGDDNTIGGPAPSDRNRIVRLHFFLGHRNVALGNTVSELMTIGTEDLRLGTAAGGNTLNFVRFINSPSASIRNNTFVLNGDLVLFDSPGATIEGNSITAEFGPAITMAGSSGVIRNNILRAPTGVAVTSAATGVEITQNDIVAAATIIFPGIAIDLDADGARNPNDPAPDADTGANSRQNFPVLTSATLFPGELVVEGTLASAPLTPYRIELFANDASDPDDAHTFLHSFMVTTDATGNATFNETIVSPLPNADQSITATATNKGSVAVPGSTPNSTSEVSAPLGVEVPGDLGFAVAAQTVDESDGTVTITVRRTGGSVGTVTVDFATSDGTATASADYTATSGTLTFGPGVTEQTFTVAINADALPEPSESFTITLGNPTGGAAIITGTTTVTIDDDDLASAQVPTLSEWAMIALAMGLAAVALLRRL